MSLNAAHRQELEQASAIAPAVIRERGYRTATDATELLALGFADYQARTPALLVPLHGVDGTNGHYALKPQHPRLDGKGKPQKYEYPAGVANMLDVPPRCQPGVLDPTVPLWFTEGAKKADCLAGLGHCVINTWGVHNWYANPQHGGYATIEPIPDWDLVTPTLDGRICYLAYDSDAWSKDKPHVGLALRRLANFLSRYGALVYIVHLPDAADGSKQGVDDVVARCGARALEDMVAGAEACGSLAMVHQLQTELQDLRAVQSAQASVLRNTALTAAQKLIALVTINDAGWHLSKEPPAPYLVRTKRLADAAGVKPHTVSAALQLLCGDDGLFDKQLTRDFTVEHGWVSSLYLTPRAGGDLLSLLQAAASYAPEHPEPTHSRRRVRCPLHPDAAVHQRCTSTCTVCGQVLSDTSQSDTVELQNSTLSRVRTTEDVSCHSDTDDVVDVRWGRERGWLIAQDPSTGETVEIPARGAPAGWTGLAMEQRARGPGP